MEKARQAVTVVKNEVNQYKWQITKNNEQNRLLKLNMTEIIHTNCGYRYQGSFDHRSE